jgi:hypothetical protein
VRQRGRQKGEFPAKPAQKIPGKERLIVKVTASFSASALDLSVNAASPNPYVSSSACRVLIGFRIWRG